MKKIVKQFQVETTKTRLPFGLKERIWLMKEFLTQKIPQHHNFFRTSRAHLMTKERKNKRALLNKKFTPLG